VHFARGEYEGIFKLLDAAEEKVAAFAPVIFGVEVAPLLDGIRRVRTEIAALGPGRLAEWDDDERRPRIAYSRLA
jgi:hypothetical protein